MRQPINAASIRELLVTHDPLAAWPAAGPGTDGYELVADLAANSLGNMLGLGHAWTVVTDVIDLQYPGFYRAVRAGDPELQRRIALVAREIWDRHGNLYPRPPSIRRLPSGPPPEPPPAAILLAEPEILEDWLRVMEVRLEGETSLPPAERKSAAAMQSMLPRFVDAYFDGAHQEREDARLAFSRFQLCCHQLSGFAGLQHAGLQGTDPARALRHGLVAESLLDMRLDWRDELLLIQALKARAHTLELPYRELVELAAARSSPRTAEFLRNA